MLTIIDKKCNLILQFKRSVFITLVFSVTCSFKKHSNMLICCSKNIIIIIIISVENNCAA